MLGGFLVESIGFPQLMFSMGIINLLYSPFVVLLRHNIKLEAPEATLLKTFATKRAGYYQFKNDD